MMNQVEVFLVATFVDCRQHDITRRETKSLFLHALNLDHDLLPQCLRIHQHHQASFDFSVRFDDVADLPISKTKLIQDQRDFLAAPS